MASIRYHHHGKYVFPALMIGAFLMWLVDPITGRDEFSIVDFILLALLPLIVIFHLVPLVRVAHLTIDPDARNFVCWWGLFVPLRTVSGHFKDIIGLEVKPVRWWMCATSNDRWRRKSLKAASRSGTWYSAASESRPS